jgi:hypothetical protein
MQIENFKLQNEEPLINPFPNLQFSFFNFQFSISFNPPFRWFVRGSIPFVAVP